MIDDGTRALLLKPRWTDPVDLFIGDIIEYDMKDGGLSIIKEEKLLPPRRISMLEKIPKGLERDMAVGKLKYDKDPSVRDIGKRLEKLFGKYRVGFGSVNNLTTDSIFSIKRDAVFLKHYVDQTQIGEYINSREQDRYDIYILLGKDELITNYQTRHMTYEVYFNTSDGDIAFKGIGDDLVEKYHMDGIVTVVKKYLRFISQFDYVAATKYMVRIIDDYKFFRLPIAYYREFNGDSSYKLNVDGKVYETEEADLSISQYLDIRYNFNHLLVPMLNMASLGVGKWQQSNKTR